MAYGLPSWLEHLPLDRQKKIARNIWLGVGSFFLVLILIGVSISIIDPGASNSGGRAVTGGRQGAFLTSLPDGSNATYTMVDLADPGNGDQKIQFSNGFLITFYQGKPSAHYEIKTFKGPYANCIGAEYDLDDKHQLLICQSLAEQEIDGYAYQGAHVHLQLHQGDIYATDIAHGADGLPAQTRSPYLARVKVQ